MVGVTGNKSWNEKLNKLGALGYEMDHSNEYPYLGYDTKFCSKVAYISVGLIVILVASLVLAPILINHFHFLDCGGTLKESDYVNENCNFTLLQSVPENLTFTASQPIQPSIYQAWLEMVRGARKSIDIISFYWTMRAVDVVQHPSAVQGETIFKELLLALGRGVKVTIVTNAADPPPSNDTTILQQAGAKVLYINMSKIIGSGVLHTKMWMVDGGVVFVGSANMDWRSLTQILETGMLVKSCSLFLNDAAKIIETYKYIATIQQLPRHWPCRLKTQYNLKNPLNIRVNGAPSAVVLASSPSAFCPPQRSPDLSALLNVINGARHFIYISVMDYAVSNLYARHKSFWPVIDDALRRAALDDKVEVRLMTSLWKHTKSSMINFMTSLAALNHTWKGVSVSARLFCVPAFSADQSSIPYSRVNHDKYMVTDQAAYITTSNWSEDYFSSTAGVSILINQTSPHPPTTPPSPKPPSTHDVPQDSIQKQLKRLFERDWYSVYSIDVLSYEPSLAFHLCNSTRQI